MKIIGIQRKTGEYQGKAYDNVMLHCSLDFPADSISEGCMTEIIKVKYDVFNDCDLYLGDNITPFYNKFGQITEIRKE